MSILPKIANHLLSVKNEEKNLLKFVKSLQLDPRVKILDIGCGYGEKSRLLIENGYTVTGVEVNADIVAANKKSGLLCLSASDFEKTNEKYDVILMSHIIEHFDPKELLNFLNYYLKRLKMGGYLIITTPLMSPYFYMDFDHVKPYQPTGMNMVFGNKTAQVQYYSPHILELKNLWFRRSPFRLLFHKSLYIKDHNYFPFLINIALAILYRLSFGLIGRTDGWMSLYQKTSDS